LHFVLSHVSDNKKYLIFKVSLILSFLRNVILFKEINFSHFDVKKIITQHFKHYFYLGNLFFSLCLVSNHCKILQKYGINCFICLTTLFFYFKAYYLHKSKYENLKINGIFDIGAFSVNISFLLAWNVSYLTISLASFLSFFTIELSIMILINLGFQILLCLSLILSISYFHDLYFSFIILIFQLGNTLNRNIFSFNNPEIDDKNNFNLLITLFSAICFIWSLLYIPRLNNDSYDLDELTKNYINDKEKKEYL